MVVTSCVSTCAPASLERAISAAVFCFEREVVNARRAVACHMAGARVEELAAWRIAFNISLEDPIKSKVV